MSSPEISKLTAVVLAGGLGTRLKAVIDNKQKVIAEVSNKPFLEYILKQLVAYNIKDIVICTGYKADAVKEYFGEKYENANITYSKEKEPLGTGGAIKNAIPHIKSEIFIAMNGDSFCEANLSKFYEFYSKKNAKIGMLLTEVDDCKRYGSVTLDENHLIKNFREKDETSGSGWINAGIYILNKGMFSNLNSNKKISIEKEIFPEFVMKSFFGFKNPKGVFIDIGTPESYKLAEKIFSNR